MSLKNFCVNYSHRHAVQSPGSEWLALTQAVTILTAGAFLKESVCLFVCFLLSHKRGGSS